MNEALSTPAPASRGAHLGEARFAVAWLFPTVVLAALLHSPWAALAALLAFQAVIGGVELWPKGHVSFAPHAALPFHRFVLVAHVPLQLLLLAAGVWVATQPSTGMAACIAAGIGVGGISGSQGISFAHELGHSRRRLDKTLAWLLMATVSYAHFMVEHYRGHHVKAATPDDPATARHGESLWRFLPRTLAGSWRSAWALEAARVARSGAGWRRSPLAWATLGQCAWLVALLLLWGPKAAVFWAAQSLYAIYLLESINYVEHYGLLRQPGERFGPQHAWNADHALTNSMVANLQRHSDHHLNAWKAYPSLEVLPGPTLPSGYVVCLYLAALPPLWFRVMHRRCPLSPSPSPGREPTRRGIVGRSD